MTQMQDKIRIAAGALFFLLGVSGFYYFGQQPVVVRLAMILVGTAIGVAIAWTTAPGTQFRTFVGESVEETRKVAWPSRKESFQTAAVVFAFVVAMAIFLWLVDKALEWSLYDLILGWKK